VKYRIHKLGRWQALLFILLPWTIVCAYFADSLVFYADRLFGFQLEKGYIALVYLIVFILIMTVAHENDNDKKTDCEENSEHDDGITG
jgi:hypothetical protein